ncbi:MAG: flagellin [Candidatus Electryonea clarkiae]|nr:flagellin [Candidatus Electryonea clarkiae]MDP8287206.1 flagellin [Candidatus Electryonea clarkiae]
MSTRINQNVLSLMTRRNIWSAQNDLDQAVTRLSSGLRVNYAWDDPAALNISERFRAQISSMVEAEKNANQAINVIRMADGAMSVIDEKLVRMRALAVQASNGTLTSNDRSALHLEFDSLRSEVTRIAQSTNYNGKYLLNGSYSAENVSGLKFHIGIFNTSNVDYYYVQMGDVTSSALGLNGLDLTNTATAQVAITSLDTAIQSKDTLRTRLGSYVNRLQSTILNQQISRESATTAEEALRDADIAEEMSNFVRAQILMQSGISMLTQANLVPQMVAQLIG